MATPAINLPPGFELDEPRTAAPVQTVVGLPEGFELDAPDEQPRQPRQGRLTRFGLGIYNATVANPVKAIASKSTVGEINQLSQSMGLMANDFEKRLINDEGVTPQEVDWYSKGKDSLGLKVRSRKLAGNITYRGPENPEEASKKTLDFLEQGKNKAVSEVDISAHVDQAHGFLDKAVDAIAGVTGTVAQLAVLGKAFPSMPAPVVWELQNEVNGGAPGAGAATYGLLKIPGVALKNVIPTTAAGSVAKFAAQKAGESAALVTSTATQEIAAGEPINKEALATSALLPFGLAVPGLARAGAARLLRGKTPTIVSTPVEPTVEAPGAIREGQTPPPPTQSTPQPGIGPEMAPVVPVEPIKQKLIDWTAKAKVFSGKGVEQAIKELRTRQAAGAKGAEATAVKGNLSESEILAKAKGGMKGGAEVPRYEPPELSPMEWDQLHQQARVAHAGDIYNSVNARDAVNKMKTGHWLTRTDFQLLEPVLGTKTIEVLAKKMQKVNPEGAWDYLHLAAQVAKSVVTFDLQYMFQARSMLSRHPVEGAKGLVATHKSYYSEKFAEARRVKMEADPDYKDFKANTSTLSWKDWGSERAEQYRPNLGGRLAGLWAERSAPLRVAGVLGRLAGRSINRAERGYSTGMMELKFNLWKLEKMKWERGGLEGDALEAKMKAYGRYQDDFLRILHAKNPSVKRVMDALNLVTFSASTTIARPRQYWDIVANKGYRVESGVTKALSMASNIVGIAAVGLAADAYEKATGKKAPFSANVNPFSPDCGIRVGDTRLDFSGGEFLFDRTLLKLGTAFYSWEEKTRAGKIVSEVQGGPVAPAGETIWRWLRGREAPIIGFAQSMVSGRDFPGKEKNRLLMALQAVTPSQIQDFIDAGTSVGLWRGLAPMLKGKTPDFGPGTGVAKGIARGMGVGLLASATSFESIGTQTYADSPFTAKRKFQDALAQERYKTEWIDLTPDQQNILKEDRVEDFSILERAVKEGRFVNPTDTRKFQEQQRSAGGLVKAALPIEQRKLLQGYPLAVSRVVGDYTLNDKRFNAYLGLLKQQLKENLFAEDFARLTPDETDEELKRVVSKAKADAWDDLKDQQGL